ncbi:hypothetical protein, partial [Legionella sp.]|uniref:hypothetical protein n=1 Tax=Legionella sp. TaxID=459 RepID=UPI003CA36887
MIEIFTKLVEIVKKPLEFKDDLTTLLDYNQYLELLESFKKNKISLIIEYFIKKALEIINSPYAHPLITQYFNKNELVLPFTNFELEPNNISQIKKLINAFHHAFLTFKDLEDIDIRNISQCYSDLKLLLSNTIESAYEASYLVTHLDVDLKALFQEELNFILPYFCQIQNYAKSQAENLQGFISQNRKSIQNTSYITINLDVDLGKLPKEKFDLIQLHLTYIEPFAEYCTENLKDVISKALKNSVTSHLTYRLGINLRGISQPDRDFIQFHLNPIEKLVTLDIKEIPFNYKIGEITGMAADQMRPIGGDVDYNFLTKFSARLPAYIHQLTHYIQNYSSQIKESQPKLNQEKLNELQNAALSLLNDIEKLKGNNLFISLKFLNYIHIISNIITLSMSTLEQIGELTDSSQDVVRDNLAQLKYDILPTLFGLVDKIEVNCLVKPGTLSNPLMEQVQKLYQALLYLPKKVIDFNTKGQELLYIEDSRFIKLRLDQAFKRIINAKKALYKTDEIEKVALDNFFSELKKPEYQTLSLQQLPTSIKETLSGYYKIIKPLMAQLDVDFNEQVITSLTGPESWSSYLKKPIFWLGGTLPTEHVSRVLAKQKALENLILKNKNSQLFYIMLNEKLIEFIHAQTKLILFPYHKIENVFAINESIPLGIKSDEIECPLGEEKLKFIKSCDDILLQDRNQLSAEQSLELYLWYQNELKKLEISKKAYTDFINILPTIDIWDLKNEDRDTLSKLYSIIQPYFIDAVPQESRETALKFDKHLIDILSNKLVNYKNAPTLGTFLKLNRHLYECFATIDTTWKQQSQEYIDLAMEKFRSENDATKLVLNTNNEVRAHHLLKNTNISHSISEFRTDLFALVGLFNKTIQHELVPEKFGIPYPEMEDRKDTNIHLKQSRQVRAIKDLYNSLYHLEGIALALEKLKNENLSTTEKEELYAKYTNIKYYYYVLLTQKDKYYAKLKKGFYVYYLLQAYQHINEIIKLTTRLATDPHGEFFLQELMSKAQNIYASFQEQTEAYHPPPEQISSTNSVQYNSLRHVLNVFYISPKHIKVLNNKNNLTAEEQQRLQKNAEKATKTITQLINDSDSYFKLFLQSPNMLLLYRELTQKLNEFTTTIHNGVLDNLDKIRATLLTPMVLEADSWEDKFGLNPGTLSEPLKKITDEYYKGLLHPLNLHSKKHIALVCNEEPLKQRMRITDNKIDEATKSIEKKEKSYKGIVELYENITEYKKLLQTKDKTSPYIIEIRESIQKIYKTVLPKLNKIKEKQKIHIERSFKDEDHLFDDFCNEGLKEYEPHFTEVEE